MKVKEQLGALQLLSYPKATSSFCHSRKKENLLTVAWEWKYRSLIVMEVLIRLKIFSGQSLFFIKVAMSACLRKISQTVYHHLQSVALWVLILEKLCCVLSVVLPLPDLFPPLFAGWGSFQQASVPTGKTVSYRLLQCDWVTAFTGVRWKHIYVNKHRYHQKFQVTFS